MVSFFAGSGALKNKFENKFFSSMDKFVSFVLKVIQHTYEKKTASAFKCFVHLFRLNNKLQKTQIPKFSVVGQWPRPIRTGSGPDTKLGLGHLLQKTQGAESRWALLGVRGPGCLFSKGSGFY
jgi:hypothetical protein